MGGLQQAHDDEENARKIQKGVERIQPAKAELEKIQAQTKVADEIAKTADAEKHGENVFRRKGNSQAKTSAQADKQNIGVENNFIPTVAVHPLDLAKGVADENGNENQAKPPLPLMGKKGVQAKACATCAKGQCAGDEKAMIVHENQKQIAEEGTN